MEVQPSWDNVRNEPTDSGPGKTLNIGRPVATQGDSSLKLFPGIANRIEMLNPYLLAFQLQFPEFQSCYGRILLTSYYFILKDY